MKEVFEHLENVTWGFHKQAGHDNQTPRDIGECDDELCRKTKELVNNYEKCF